MPELAHSAISLKEINEKLGRMRLPRIRPDQVHSVLAVIEKAKLVSAIQRSSPDNPTSVNYLRSVLQKAGVLPAQPDPVQKATPAEDEATKPVEENDRFSFHVYGGKAALSFEVDNTRSGFPTIALDAASATTPRQYNWKNKVRIQLTRSELPQVMAVLVGAMPRCEFKNHGPDNSKGFSMERQDGGKIFIKVFAKDEGVKAVPVEAADVYFICALFTRQLKQATPWLDATSILSIIRATQPR